MARAQLRQRVAGGLGKTAGDGGEHGSAAILVHEGVVLACVENVGDELVAGDDPVMHPPADAAHNSADVRSTAIPAA